MNKRVALFLTVLGVLVVTYAGLDYAAGRKLAERNMQEAMTAADWYHYPTEEPPQPMNGEPIESQALLDEMSRTEAEPLGESPEPERSEDEIAELEMVDPIAAALERGLNRQIDRVEVRLRLVGLLGVILFATGLIFLVSGARKPSTPPAQPEPEEGGSEETGSRPTDPPA